MFRANIYSLETLRKPTRESIHNGIDMVAAFMGETAVKQECRLILSTNRDGLVLPERVGLGKLDKMVELHILAVPFVQNRNHQQRLGLAGVGRGYGFIDTLNKSKNADRSIFTTSAHEVSHAFGFVLEGASQTDKNGGNHCADPECIMHHSSIERVVYPKREPGEPLRATFKKYARTILSDAHFIEHDPERIVYQHDFCLDCKQDIRQNGAKNLNQIRINRALLKQHI